jgi:hypothetical protein
MTRTTRSGALGIAVAAVASVIFGQVPGSERIPISDPARLEALGFPRDARNVFLWSKADLAGGRDAAAREEPRTPDTWGTNDGFSTIMNYQLQAKNYAADETQAYILYHQGSAGTSCVGGSAAECLGYAQISAPDGALLRYLNIWGFDSSADADLHYTVIENCEPVGSVTGGTATILGAGDVTTEGGDFLRAHYFGDQPPTLNNRDCGYTVRLNFTDGGVPPQGVAIRVRKLGVTWRRQVSPGPATASFDDVPTDHQYFQFVEALVKSGITVGCGLDSFCPDAPLTRGQMAVFLAKALGLQWP